MLQDVTESRRAAERLQQATQEYHQKLEKTTYYDDLTGLPNRTLFAERMAQGIEQVQRTGRWMAVLYLDIDDFKPVNEAYGQELGNQLLINTAERLRSCLNGDDTLARLGGDEFALLLHGSSSDAELERYLKELQVRLVEPFVSDVATVTLSASIGVTVYPQDDADPDTLLRHADQAMLMAKHSGKACYQRFDTEDGKRIRAHLEWVDRLRLALEQQEFVLYYQPKIDLNGGAVVGAEALIRWQHPERGLLLPGEFLPAIETDDLIVDIGDWVIDQALSQMDLWREAGLDLAVSVNIAAQQLKRPHFIDRLQQQLAAHPGTARHRLELEVLETSALDDIGEVEELIVACRQMGVGFSLDDFGTGYSSLTYLRRLSADTLKIDQSFIRDMLDDPEDQAIVAGVIGLAAAFKRQVIAEGVETVDHGKALLELGCTMLQGYGIARPMPAKDLPSWVKVWPDSAWADVCYSATDSDGVPAVGELLMNITGH